MTASSYHCDDCLYKQGRECSYGYDLDSGDCPDLWEPEEHYIPPARGKHGWTDEEATEYGDMMDHQYRDDGRYL